MTTGDKNIPHTIPSASVDAVDEKAQLQFNEAMNLIQHGNAQAAIICYDKAIEIAPDYADAHNWKGNALQMLEQLDAAIACYDKAIALEPNNSKPHHNRGIALHKCGQLDAAITSFDAAIAIKPDHADTYYGRGLVFEDLLQQDAAVASYKKALSIQPDFEYLYDKLLHERMRLCDWDNFDNNVAALIEKIEKNEIRSTGFSTLSLTCSLSVQRKAAKDFIASKYPENTYLGPIAKRPKSEKIRIGYYSADFYNHATAYLMAELFELHDRDKFELIAFHFGPDKKDEMRERLENTFDQFIDVRLKNDIEIAALSRQMGIDIAIDLKGFTISQRIGIFSFRAAPIQVNYIGYPGTVGADYIDYMIADTTIIPKESRQFYSEKIVRLPHSYQVNDRKRKIADKIFTKEELGLPTNEFIFCCFNRNYKITPHIFDSWMKILNAVEGSVLWLLEENSTVTLNLRKEAKNRGLDPDRLIFAQRADLPEHLARHKAADLFLDTLPCNAHTTASDALWSRLPVLTCLGESFASRVAASLLNAIDLPELITKTQQEYEALAIDLATNPQKLKAIKDKLVANQLTTPLFDTNLYTKNIEDAYIQMYDRYQNDLEPDHIDIG